MSMIKNENEDKMAASVKCKHYVFKCYFLKNKQCYILKHTIYMFHLKYEVNSTEVFLAKKNPSINQWIYIIIELMS